jgi:hypothetical protein
MSNPIGTSDPEQLLCLNKSWKPLVYTLKEDIKHPPKDIM